MSDSDGDATAHNEPNFDGEETTAPRHVVMLNRRDEQGLMHRSISLSDSGQLGISGHDLGPGVEAFFGANEYEFERTYSADDTTRARELLGVAPDDGLLQAITERFRATHELESFLEGHGNEGEFWSRVGD
ncbi:hypothetical protein [Nostocoides veronense]|uniref:Uncharacterized protein n=1 Tax=Nostocoides veronense TaxID=330836 RepID=A0ABP4Y2X5_9MICO